MGASPSTQPKASWRFQAAGPSTESNTPPGHVVLVSVMVLLVFVPLLVSRSVKRVNASSTSLLNPVVDLFHREHLVP